MSYPDDVHTAGEEGQRPARSSGRELHGPGVDALLRRASDLIGSARPMPLSASVMINKEEVLDLLGEAIERLPEELRAARWLLKEREEYLAKVRAEGDEIVEAARARVERMVQRTEVVKASEQRARHIVQSAEDEARRLRHECEDFCDQRLASFEIVLDKVMRTVQIGRERLNPNLTDHRNAPDADDKKAVDAFFDQDRS